jgi:hypothetical protein
METGFQRTIKIFFNAITAAKLFTARGANKTQFNGADQLRIYIGLRRISDRPSVDRALEEPEHEQAFHSLRRTLR